MQNDMNGLSWGILPDLMDRGVSFVWLGANTYSGGTYGPVPRMLRWRGPDGRSLWLHVAPHYNAGYHWFHQADWRRGPVPSAHDVWFAKPRAGDIFEWTPTALQRSHEILQKHLASLHEQAPPVLALPITNQWRFDNDPPFPPLSDFVRAWNDAGLQPALRLSTPSQYLTALADCMPAEEALEVRGDWGDWWADAPMAHGDLVSMTKRACHRLRSLESMMQRLNLKDEAVEKLIDEGWRWAAFFEEHTFGAYESVPKPWTPRSLSNLATKIQQATSCHEAAAQAECRLIQSTEQVGRFRDHKGIHVFNPNSFPRGGSIKLPARSLPPGSYRLWHETTGVSYPLQPLLGPEMDVQPDLSARPREDVVPGDEWGFVTTEFEAILPPISPVATERFQVIPAQAASHVNAETHHHRFNFEVDETGRLRDLSFRSEATAIQDHQIEDFAYPVLQQPSEPWARHRLLERGPDHALGLLKPIPLHPHWHERSDFAGGKRLRRRWRHPSLWLIEQRIDFLDGEDRIDIHTTLWMKDLLPPLVVTLALPLAGDGSTWHYHSMGRPTRVGLDQLPGSAAEWVMSDGTLSCALAPKTMAILECPESPLTAFESLGTRSGRTSFVPSNQHVYLLLHASLWSTNFPATMRSRYDFLMSLRLNPAVESETSSFSTLPLITCPIR
jgi:hypothetical protein